MVDCIACSHQCKSCTDTAISCLSCNGSNRETWETNNLCECNSHYYDEGVSDCA